MLAQSLAENKGRRMTSYLATVFGFLTGFALCHSLLASEPVKRWASARLGRFGAAYRLGYNLFHLGLLVLFLALFLPGDRLWYRWPETLVPAARVIQAAGAALAFWVLFISFSFAEFAGLAQLRRGIKAGDETEAPSPLRVDGPFRYCRHPLYLGTLLAFACQPNMTVLGAAFTLFVAAYGLFGSIPEERKLAARYGPAYSDYRARTKRLIPFLL